MCHFINEVLITIAGGLLFTFILFLLNEKVFTKHNLSGEWILRIKVISTSYHPFKDLEIEYAVHLLQMGNTLKGSGEKLKDLHPDGKTHAYPAKKRVVIEIEGYYYKKYFSKSTLYFTVKEFGTQRPSRGSYDLVITDKKNLSGAFSTTAAFAAGEVQMKKK